MDTIYITGHRNPDTDSIVSAMAYAALKNALGQRQYEAARLGHHYVGTEHLLLGILREGDGVAVRVLSGTGVEPRRLPARHPVRRCHHQPGLADHAEGQDLRHPRGQ